MEVGEQEGLMGLECSGPHNGNGAPGVGRGKACELKRKEEDVDEAAMTVMGTHAAHRNSFGLMLCEL